MSRLGRAVTGWMAVVAGAAGLFFFPQTGRAASPVLTQAETRQAEQWLKDLGFWTGPVDGVWDEATRHALVAFQKVQRARPTGRLTRAEHNALSMAGPMEKSLRPKEKGPAHIEVDIARQILYLVDDEGKVGNILPISSGNGKSFKAKGWTAQAVTPCGRFEVYSRYSGWRSSELGEMHNPLYIVGGIAIHGSESVPATPASHGCVRIPLFASAKLPKMVPKNMPVLVYGCPDDPSRLRPVQVAETAVAPD